MDTKARKTRLARRTYTAASIIEALAWLVGIGSVIGGIVVATHTEEGWDSTSHPWVVSGLIMIVGGIVYATIVIMVTAYIKTRVVDFVD